MKVYVSLELYGHYLSSEFCDPNPKSGTWGDHLKNLKNRGFSTIRAYFKSDHLKEYYM